MKSTSIMEMVLCRNAARELQLALKSLTAKSRNLFLFNAKSSCSMPQKMWTSHNFVDVIYGSFPNRYCSLTLLVAGLSLTPSSQNMSLRGTSAMLYCFLSDTSSQCVSFTNCWEDGSIENVAIWILNQEQWSKKNLIINISEHLLKLYFIP